MMRWPAPEPQSALVVLVPEAEKLVAPFRSAYDPAAGAGMPAHITILFPFASPTQTDDAIRSRLQACFSARLPFDYKLAGIKRFPGLLYLAPEPDGPFRALTLSVCEVFPECSPYEGKHPDIVPHLTVASVTNGPALERIAHDLAAVAGRLLPIPAKATEIALMDNRHGPWAVVTTFPLGRS